MKIWFSKFCFVWLILLLISSRSFAQEYINVPKESSVFYTEDGNNKTQKKVPRSAPSNYWDITSTVESCFDESHIGEYAWIMTADGETKLSVILSYSGDDSRYTISSQEVNFYFYDGNDLFHDNNKELISEIDKYVGSFTTETTEKTATVHLTAPDKYPFLSYPYYSFYVVIKVKFENGGTASVAKNIGISRNGVFLLHGLNSSDACFDSFRNYLMNSNHYINSQVHLKDYSASNTSSFYTNTHVNQVVRIGLFELSSKLFQAGIASSKYDMIGHSMGGILERLYCQEVDNSHTNKLITLNTPHFGSLLGNVYVDYQIIQLIPDVRENSVVQFLNEKLNEAFPDDPSMQAVMDLGINSLAIQNLNSVSVSNLYGIPVCAVGTEIDWVNYEGIKYAVSEPFYEAYGYLMAHIFDKEIPHERNYLNNNANGSDAVVSVDSQKGGCAASYIYKGTWGNAFHCNSPEWSVVHDQLLHLLRASESYDFSYRGFAAVPNNAPSHVRKASETEDKYITKFEEATPSSYIRINIEAKDEDEYTHEIRLSHSDDMATIMAFAFLSKDEMIADYDKDIMYFNLKDYEGSLTVYAIGRTDYNALLIDSVKVKIGQINDITELRNSSTLQYLIQENKLKIENKSEPYSIIIYDITGHVIAEMNSNPTHIYKLPLNNEFLIISVKTKEDLQTIKVKKSIIY